MILDLQSLPSPVVDALLIQSRREGKPVQEVALAALIKGVESQIAAIDPVDLADPDHNWIDSPAFEQALIEFAHLDAQPG